MPLALQHRQHSQLLPTLSTLNNTNKTSLSETRKTSSVALVVLLLSVFVVTTLLTVVPDNTTNNSSHTFMHSMPASITPAFSLLVTLTFVDAASKDNFLTAFTRLARYVREEEPNTLAYDALQSENDPLQLLILERYVDKNYYLQTHKTSAAFLEFRPKLQVMLNTKQVTMSGHSYLDSQIRFGQRQRRSS
jgi:quinol monooxygenase YgiN